MYFDRFDIVEAYYIFYNENHSGQFSLGYKRLSKILTYFKPSPSFSRESLSENAKAILEKLEIQSHVR